jgi:hypothetical protein
VEENVRRSLSGDPLAVHFDHVLPAHDRVQLTGRSVHANSPLADQLVGPSPRSDSRPGEECVESHCRIVARGWMVDATRFAFSGA